MLTGGDPLLGCRAVDLGLDRKDLVNAAHRLDGARRLVQIGQLEEFASAVRPAGCLGDRPRTALGLAQFAKPGIGVGLQDPGPAGEMPARMLTAAVARVAEQRRRRVRAGKRSVIANIDPPRPVTVLPLASTGTVVSSPCRRAAASTWRRTSSISGENRPLPAGYTLSIALEWLPHLEELIRTIGAARQAGARISHK